MRHSLKIIVNDRQIAQLIQITTSWNRFQDDGGVDTLDDNVLKLKTKAEVMMC